MSESDGPISVWTHWTDPERVPFHRFCVLFPRSRSSAESETEKAETPTDASTTEGDSQQDPGFRFVSGRVRVGLRYSPLIVLAIAVAFVAIGEVSDGLVGLSAHFPTISVSTNPLYVLAGMLWIALLVVPLRRVEVIPTRRIAGAIGLYGLVGVLTIGTILAILLTARPESVP